MEDEIEDLVGDLKYTDSQKSVTTSNVYSLDFTDSSSDKHNSSGKETYVVDCDSDDSDKTFPLLNHKSSPTNHNVIAPVQINYDIVANPLKVSPQAKQDAYIQYETSLNINQSTTTSVHKTSCLGQEIYTQTSKTIIELAALDKPPKNGTNQDLETQTSLISITENRTFEYKIQVADTPANLSDNRTKLSDNHITTQEYYNLTGNPLLNNSLDDCSSKYPISQTESSKTVHKSDSSSNSEIINIYNDDSETSSSEDQNDCNVFKDSSDSDSDMEDDSLMDKSDQRQNDRGSISDVTSLCNDVDDLYKKLSQTMDHSPDRKFDTKSQEQERRFGLLTPLTEESTKKESNSLLDITPNDSINSERTDKLKKELSFKHMTQESKSNELKLPPIDSSIFNSDSPHIKYSLSISSSQHLGSKAAALKCLYEGQDRWEITSKELASGESMLIRGRSGLIEELEKEDTVQLPPIEEKFRKNLRNISEISVIPSRNEAFSSSTPSISIKKRIKELKMSNHEGSPNRNQSRSGSPGSVSPNESRLGEIVDRGCEALCIELLKRLRSSVWVETAETLEEMPKLLEKFWSSITENRIADLIRQVSAHVESPRTQVARTACSTLASLIKNTNYTKKPDFYEAVTILLIKTGSFSRPVRTAANLALDEIVCEVDLTHCVTALCLHGAGHKSGLVRGAAARLLVVCCALAGGGRELLRARPPSAANARRLALSSLASLLSDKNTEVRKYAERLYTMLRPLSNFEAYYLTDVDVDLATRQMKKYDNILCDKQSR